MIVIDFFFTQCFHQNSQKKVTILVIIYCLINWFIVVKMPFFFLCVLGLVLRFALYLLEVHTLNPCLLLHTFLEMLRVSLNV